MVLRPGRSTRTLDAMRSRTIGAFCAAPAAAALAFGCISAISSINDTGHVYADWISLGIVLEVSAVITVLIAVPAYLVLKRLRLVRWWSALGAGACVGALFAHFSGVQLWPLSFGLLAHALIGLCAGTGFWLIYRGADGTLLSIGATGMDKAARIWCRATVAQSRS